MEYIQEKELRLLLHRELSYWKILEQVAGELTQNQDHRVNLQGMDFQFSEDASLCQAGKGASTQGSQMENLVDSLQGDGSSNLENQEFPACKAVTPVSIQESWIKAFVNEPWNVQERCKKVDMENTIYKCDWGDYGFRISCGHDDHRKPERGKPRN